MSRPNTARHAGRIPLHNFEGNFRRQISRSEADSLLENGKAVRHCRRCGKSSDRGRCIGSAEYQFILRMKEPERRDEGRHGDFNLRELEGLRLWLVSRGVRLVRLRGRASLK